MIYTVTPSCTRSGMSVLWDQSYSGQSGPLTLPSKQLFPSTDTYISLSFFFEQHLTTGDAVDQAFLCENNCDRRECKNVVISKQCYDMVQSYFECESVGWGGAGNYVVLGSKQKIETSNQLQLQEISLTETQLIKLRGFIPPSVMPFLRMPNEEWAGEFRQVTIMCLALPFSSNQVSTIDSAIIERIHQRICVVQRSIYRYQGLLHRFVVDDRGSYVIAICGLPPMAHDNDPGRAVLAALEIRIKLTAFDVKYAMKSGTSYNPAAIGITSGVVYVAFMGNDARREYSIVGDVAHQALRLMRLTKKSPDLYSGMYFKVLILFCFFGCIFFGGEGAFL